MRTEVVVREVDAGWGAPCSGCAQALVGQEVVLSLLMGFRTAPRCADCLAQGTGRARASFLDDARARLLRLDCYRAGWEHADRRQAAAGEPPALGALVEGDIELSAAEESTAAPLASTAATPPQADTFFDAGEMSCGDLALILRKELTGHVLLHMEPPHYWIQRRTES